MRKLLLILIFIIFIYNVSASCGEEQIDLNTASAEKLDEIVYIGPARIEQIIAIRPFSSVDDLIRVSGIGDVYLSAIKAQGLACVDNIEDEDKNEDEKNETNVNSNISSEEEFNEEVSQLEQPKERQTIILNPQVIKSEESKKEISENYALYGFVAFCVLIGILFIIKNKKHKNEFR